MALHGFTLPSSAFQLTLEGLAGSNGKALVKEVLERYKTVAAIIYRTLERIKKQPYRDNISRAIRKSFEVYVTVPQAGSFSAAFEISQQTEQISLPGLDDLERPQSILLRLSVEPGCFLGSEIDIQIHRRRSFHSEDAAQIKGTVQA